MLLRGCLTECLIYWKRMSEGGAPSKYVKLTKEQAPVDEVNPGELNQPIQVPHLAVHKCNECGQTLPENFEAPADEPWTTGIFGCTEDMSSFWQGLFCPSVLFGRVYETLSDEETAWTKACICHSIVVEGGLTVASIAACAPGIDPHTTFLMWEGLLFVWWMCGIYTGNVRQTLQRKYHLQNSPCDPCMVHCCLHFCAVCQEHREMKNRLSDNFVMPMTVVNPPPVQEMSASNDSVPIQGITSSNSQKMIGRDAGSIADGDLPSSRLSTSSPCRRNGLVDTGKRDVFYGEDDVAGLMFREEELEQDTVMRAYRSDEAMRSLQNTRSRRSRRFFCCECFDFLRLVFSRNGN
ncbi:hypothetical protein HID58_038001 [Brassica napus]|uniref:Cell number regulator 6 n=2 Tax=Brassica TaxID=3705 RepID=A0ABQ8BN00_BRANA|nr:hypothetical protein HID58_038001 [Brassica napus]